MYIYRYLHTYIYVCVCMYLSAPFENRAHDIRLLVGMPRQRFMQVLHYACKKYTKHVSNVKIYVITEYM